MDEIEHDLGELPLELQKILRAILANCATCRAQGEAEAEAPTPRWCTDDPRHGRIGNVVGGGAARRRHRAGLNRCLAGMGLALMGLT